MARTLYAEKAEQEANKIGMEFAHSSDVARDMSRAYHVDFSNIQVHHDAAADSRVKAAGKDALAQGNHLFFGEGIFESNEPDAKALVAHEFAHTMQQGAVEGAGAVQESAPMGAEQGGLKSWFRKLFGKKKKEPESQAFDQNMEISEPTLLDNPDSPDFTGYHAEGENKLMTFQTSQSRALFELAKAAGPEGLRSNDKLRKLIMEDYKTNMSQRLQQYDDVSYDQMFSAVLRKDYAGEMKTFNMMMAANLPENMASDLTDVYMQNPEAAALPKDESGKYIIKNEWADPMLDYVGNYVENDEVMMEILKAGMEGYGNSKHFTGENEGNASNMMMNSVILRGVAPMLMSKVADEKNAYVQQRSGGKNMSVQEKTALDHEIEDKAIGIPSKNATIALQKRVNTGQSESAQRFRNLLKGRFRK